MDDLMQAMLFFAVRAVIPLRRKKRNRITARALFRQTKN